MGRTTVCCKRCGKRLTLTREQSLRDSYDKEYYCHSCSQVKRYVGRDEKGNSIWEYLDGTTIVKKNHHIFRKIFIILIVIGVLVGGNYILTNLTGNSRALAEKNYDHLMKNFESEGVLEDTSLELTIKSIRFSMEEPDIVTMDVFDGDTCSKIQKYTSGGKTTFLYEIKNDKFEDLKSGSYWYDGEKIFSAVGNEKKVYYSSAAEYAPLYEKLTRLLPQNFVIGQNIDKSLLYVSDDSKHMMYKLTGENTSAVIDFSFEKDDCNSYYEKTGERLIKVSYVSKAPISKIPNLSDCTEVK